MLMRLRPPGAQMKRILLIIFAVPLLLQGCQTSKPPRALSDARSPLAYCQGFLSLVDDAVIRAATTDTGVFRIEGYPYLRASRFLAGMRETEISNPAIAQCWLEGMHHLDLEAREKEILTLDNDQFQQLANQSRHLVDRDEFIQRVRACSNRLFAHGLDQPGLASKVRNAIDIPDVYRSWRRIVGLYPLVALPVAYVSANVFDEFRDWHALPPDKLATVGTPVVYHPSGGIDNDRLEPAALYRSAPRDALGLPEMTPKEKDRIARTLAPVIIQDTAGGYDRIGKVQWRNGAVVIRPNVPVGYFYYSYGRFNRHPSLQINYVFWYSHRDGDNAPWIERGRLDGLTIRVSLDPNGQPVMLDIMNNCGCYHFFVPKHARIRTIKNPWLGLNPLVPTWLPDQFPRRRVALRVNSGWHQVQHIGVESTSGDTIRYELRPYRELEMLPDDNGQHRSMFTPDGIARGSGRIEPYIFFSMGIPAIGSMRQRGHHAIKLVGNAHFDHPGLFDDTFEYR